VRVIFCGRKTYAADALRYIVGKLGWEVALVITSNEPLWMPSPWLSEYAQKLHIPVATLSEANNHITRNFMVESGFYLKGVDLLISYLFSPKIVEPLLSLPKMGCINFHPAPLPEFAGFGGYNYAILEESEWYGCSAHFMDESIDTGDIIKVRRIALDSNNETAFSLERRTQAEMLLLFREICDIIDRGDKLPRVKQHRVHLIKRGEFEKAREIRPEDNIEVVDRKIRAFWYPPYPGAVYKINGKTYTLVSDDILYSLGEELNNPR